LPTITSAWLTREEEVEDERWRRRSYFFTDVSIKVT
jgi:hypothetical protein